MAQSSYKTAVQNVNILLFFNHILLPSVVIVVQRKTALRTGNRSNQFANKKIVPGFAGQFQSDTSNKKNTPLIGKYSKVLIFVAKWCKIDLLSIDVLHDFVAAATLGPFLLSSRVAFEYCRCLYQHVDFILFQAVFWLLRPHDMISLGVARYAQNKGYQEVRLQGETLYFLGGPSTTKNLDFHSDLQIFELNSTLELCCCLRKCHEIHPIASLSWCFRPPSYWNPGTAVDLDFC